MTKAVAPLMLLGLALTACSTGEPGNPTPATITSADGTTEPAPTTTSAPSGSSLADFKPCDALTAIAGSFPLTEVEPDDADSCAAEYTPAVSVRLDVYADKGLADYVGGPNAEPSDITINGRKAKLVRKAFSSTLCAVAIEVTPKSRVDAVGSANASLDEACAAAKKLAEAVEPKLPK